MRIPAKPIDPSVELSDVSDVIFLQSVMSSPKIVISGKRTEALPFAPYETLSGSKPLDAF